MRFNLAISSVNIWGPYNGGGYNWLVSQPQPSSESKLKLNDAKINVFFRCVAKKMAICVFMSVNDQYNDCC